MAPTKAILSFLLIASTALAQMMPINPGCAPSSPSVKTLTYTPWMAPQIAPTSTVYRLIVTHYDYVVWCSNGAATVTNVQANPAATGVFTEKTVLPVLTVEAVGCIPSDLVLTRREIRGNEYVKRGINKKDIEVPAATSPEHPKSTHPQRTPFLAGIPFPIPKGWKRDHFYQHEAAQAKRQVVPTTLSPEAATLISQLQTAQYALDLCNSDFNLTEICSQLRQPAAITPLANVGVNAMQAGDIVCFASVYGIDLKTNNSALLGDLAAAIYGLELGDNFTTTANTTGLCNRIDLGAAPDLGIDEDAVNNFICGGPSSSVTVTAVTTQTVIVVPGSPTATFTASGAVSNSNSTLTSLTASGAGVSSGSAGPSGVGTGALNGTFPDTTGGTVGPSAVGTGAPNGGPNGTFPNATGGTIVSYTQRTGGTISHTYGTAGTAASHTHGTAGTVVSGGAMPTGWGNLTGTDSLGIDFPEPSDAPQTDGANTPMDPGAQQYYPATTLETVPATYGSYD